MPKPPINGEVFVPKPFLIHRIKRDEYIDMPQLHCHENYELYYLLAGERNYFIEDKTYRVPRGSLVFVNKHVLHRTTDPRQAVGHERILILFQKPFLGPEQSLLDIASSPYRSGPPVLTLTITQQRIVEELLFKMLREAKRKESAFDTLLKSVLIELLIYALRIREQAIRFPEEPENAQHLKARKIMQYINSHYADPITLGSLSKRFFISPYYMSRLFKSATGFSIMAYVIAVRIKEAQILLRETVKPVTEISADTGFGDLVHFCRTFKKQTGITPQQYRHKLR